MVGGALSERVRTCQRRDCRTLLERGIAFALSYSEAQRWREYVAENRIRIVELFSLLLLVVLSYAFYRVMAPFLLDLFLAIVAASLFFGFNRRVTRLIGGRQRLGAFLTTVILVLLVAVPVSVVAFLVYTQAVSTASSWL